MSESYLLPKGCRHIIWYILNMLSIDTLGPILLGTIVKMRQIRLFYSESNLEVFKLMNVSIDPF